MPRPRVNHENFLRIRHAELKKLTIFQAGVLIKLATMAAMSPMPGYVCGNSGAPLTLEQVAEALKTTYNLVSKNIELLQNAGFIVLSDNGIQILNWWSRWQDTRTAYQKVLMRKRRQKGHNGKNRA